VRSASLDVKGFFWLPGTPRNRVSGVLTVGDGGRLKLDTIGLLGPAKFAFGHLQKHARVVGIVEDHGSVTLDSITPAPDSGPHVLEEL
jgi:hypothetical protein